MEVLVEYPFFVFGQGWSSCCPDRTTQLLELPCTKLSVGDVCISLTLKNLRNGSLKKTQPLELATPASVPASSHLKPTELSQTLPKATVEEAPGTASGKTASASEGRVEVGMGVEGATMWKMEISCLGKEFLKVRWSTALMLAPVSHQGVERGDGLPPKVGK